MAGFRLRPAGVAALALGTSEATQNSNQKTQRRGKKCEWDLCRGFLTSVDGLSFQGSVSQLKLSEGKFMTLCPQAW